MPSAGLQIVSANADQAEEIETGLQTLAKANVDVVIVLQTNLLLINCGAVAILRGAKAGDLPIEFPTNLWLAVNLRTAKALGLAVAPTLLARANEVIEYLTVCCDARVRKWHFSDVPDLTDDVGSWG